MMQERPVLFAPHAITEHSFNRLLRYAELHASLLNSRVPGTIVALHVTSNAQHAKDKTITHAYRALFQLFSYRVQMEVIACRAVRQWVIYLIVALVKIVIVVA